MGVGWTDDEALEFSKSKLVLTVSPRSQEIVPQATS
jgi:hypothetical protein